MLIYLASPYNGTPEEIERRMNIVLKDIADLQLQGHFVLTPLLGHFTLKYNTIPTTDAYWYYYSEAVLKSCKFDKMRVLMLKGWDESRGVLSEIQICKDLNIPIEYVEIEKKGESLL